MTSMLCVTLLQTVLFSAGVDAGAAAGETYEEAHRLTSQTGKPLVVMVSTDWCAPCQTMKKTVLPRVREGGLLRKVAFAIVNPDRDGDLAERLTGGGPIPQLVMFRRTANGWTRKKLVGGQSVETVEEFIKEGLTQNEADKKASPKDGKKSPPEKTRTAGYHEDADEDAEDFWHG